MRTLIPLPLLFATALPLATAAQTPDSVCLAMRHLEVGWWAEYRMAGQGEHEAHGTMRNAIVGTEVRNDTTLWWHESHMAAPEGQLIVQSLVPGYPFSPNQIHDLVMQMGNDPPERMPDAMLQQMRMEGASPETGELTLAECRQAKNLGWEDVTVPDGAWHVLHTQTTTPEGDTVDVWMSPAVPFGLVKVMGAGLELELVGHGTDATSAFERPRPGGMD